MGNMAHLEHRLSAEAAVHGSLGCGGLPPGFLLDRRGYERLPGSVAGLPALLEHLPPESQPLQAGRASHPEPGMEV